MPPNILLIGFMGAGKSTVGRLLAQELSWRFVDTDQRIETIRGESVANLFARDGEAAFRETEEMVVQGVCAGIGQVIATGGGAPLRESSAVALRAAGMVVWLTVRPEIVRERTRRREGVRPLLATEGDDPMAKILTLLSERGPVYQKTAHKIADTSDRPATAVVAEILRLARRFDS